MSNLVEELKRRNVIRVGIAYLVAAWVVLQIADLVLENIGAPDWVMQTLMLVLALGFPVVLLFSWAFELTPEGIKREKDIFHGEYAALTGDVEAMISSLRKVIATGLYTTAGFYTAPFNPYRDDARFNELEQEAIRRANQERRKLGILET